MVSVQSPRALRTIPFLIVACFVALPAHAKYSGGTGEPNDPYQIATAADLLALGETPGDYDKHFILTADIDLDPNLPGRKVFDKALIAPGSPAREYPRPLLGSRFTGVFDGNGHTISHLTIEGGYDLGVFGKLEGEVKDLGVVDVNITGVGDYVGGLVAYNTYGHMTRCYSTGEVSGVSHVGGLVGKNLGEVTNCYSSNTVVGTGSFDTAFGDSGGVGGLVGTNTGTVASCHSDSAVTGRELVGGLVGLGGGIVRSYSSGAVSGVSEVGGLVGRGGATACFWDTQTSGQATSAGGIGKTTTEMQTASTFLEAGWDFVGETANGGEDIWKISEGVGYPRFSWERYSGGTGAPNDPYQIATAADLIALGETPEDYDKHFILTADIDLAPNLPGGKVFDKAVIAPAGAVFTGILDGNDHTISHLKIKGESYLGLFGRLGSGAEVKSLGVVDVNITGMGDYVGGLVGSNSGTITECYSTGAVSGEYRVGGLVGYNDYRGNSTVAQCYSTVSARGGSSVGGLVGANAGDLTRCYSVGVVGGSGENVGGMVGSGVVRGRDGSMNGAATACFWDIQTSGQATSAGGTGKTTTEMQTAKTFLDAGWEFAGEMKNGIHEFWQIPEGGGYPILATPRQLQGSGTTDDPYVISNGLELGAMIHYSPYAHYRLDASIDLSGIHWCTAVIPRFAGTFEGNGCTILHLTIRGEGALGLFGELKSGSNVKDLAVADVNIVASGSHVGGLAAINGGAVTGCHSTGTVSGSERAWNGGVGGLVGYNSSGTVTQSYSACAVSGPDDTWLVGGLVGYNSSGTVAQCWSTGSVTGFSVVGGLVGYNYEGSIDASCSDGVVQGEWDVGGLVGYNSLGVVTRCYSTGLVGGYSRVGGLVGRTWSSILTECYSRSAVSGSIGVGGLVGDNEESRLTQCYSIGMVSGGYAVGGLVAGNSYGTVEQCYSTAPVSGTERVGGLVGANDGAVTLCYSTGVVNGTDGVGGLVGWNQGDVTHCYSTGQVSGKGVGGLVGENHYGHMTASFWDTQTSGRVWSDGGTGKTTTEMQTGATFLDAGWDFVNETANGTEDIWWILEGLDYPRLWWELTEKKSAVTAGE